MFDRDPGDDSKTASSNHVTMPSRNWAMITENSEAIAAQPSTNGDYHLSAPSNADQEHSIRNGNGTSTISLDTCTGKDGHSPLHPGEENAGSNNRAVTTHGQKGDGSLDICIRVEKNQHDADGKTRSYGIWVPSLQYQEGTAERHLRKRDAIHGHVAVHNAHQEVTTA